MVETQEYFLFEKKKFDFWSLSHHVGLIKLHSSVHEDLTIIFKN